MLIFCAARLMLCELFSAKMHMFSYTQNINIILYITHIWEKKSTNCISTQQINVCKL